MIFKPVKQAGSVLVYQLETLSVLGDDGDAAPALAEIAGIGIARFEHNLAAALVEIARRARIFISITHEPARSQRGVILAVFLKKLLLSVRHLRERAGIARRERKGRREHEQQKRRKTNFAFLRHTPSFFRRLCRRRQSRARCCRRERASRRRSPRARRYSRRPPLERRCKGKP